MTRTTLPAAVAGLALSLLCSCSDSEIRSYRAPKEADKPLPPSLASNPNDMSTGADDLPPPPEGGGLTWSAPSSWPAKPLTSMRKGSHSIPGPGGDADFSVVVLPGAAGGVLDNVNRWRGQVQLPPISNAQLSSESQEVHVPGLKLVVVDLPSPDSKSRILGAITEVGTNTWFFKMTGPSATVEAAKPDFLRFLQTVKAP
ncbi:MAG: hypothetical protein SFV32_07990 [Opitutaceae bacterium]|nr:hypothetical protein [Opitutaceae bacterium]